MTTEVAAEEAAADSTLTGAEEEAAAEELATFLLEIPNWVVSADCQYSDEHPRK